MYFADDKKHTDHKKHIDDIAQKERDESRKEEESKLDNEANSIHPSLLERIKTKFKRKKKSRSEK